MFHGVVDQAVLDRSGKVAIPAGSDVDLIVRSTSDRELTLDLDTITVNGQRYTVDTEDSVTTTSQGKDGIGANGRTGKYVGGGALLGAVIGAIAGGGKGAAIGAGAGAAAGAGTQILTRGRNVSVPTESLLTFRLQEPLRTGIVDNSFVRDGRRYRPNYSNQGSSNQGYVNQGYSNPSQGNLNPGSAGTVRIRADNNVTWQAPGDARVFVQIDNGARKLFASGASGTQEAPWMLAGHQYVFILVDSNGNEIGRDQLDLRPGARRR